MSADGLRARAEGLLWGRWPSLAVPLAHDLSAFSGLCMYAAVLRDLLATGRFDPRPMAELLGPAPQGRVALGLRHDVDIDLPTALAMARVERDLGLRASYYALHTAPYYGRWRGGAFTRHPGCLRALAAIQAMGHEVGLHLDALRPAVERGVPVEQTLAAELAALRDAGLRVTGFASHGSMHTYGAANYEIFRGLSLEGRTSFTDAAGRSLPLGHVDMAAHGLDYEAAYMVRQGRMSAAQYDALYAPQFTCPGPETDWRQGAYTIFATSLSRDAWLVHDQTSGSVSHTPARDLAGRLAGLGDGPMVLDLHPMYVGRSPWRGVVAALGALARRIPGGGPNREIEQ